MFLTRLVIVLLTWRGGGATVKMLNASNEYKVRQELLASYNRFVLPVISNQTAVVVSFSLQLKSLIQVDNKKQMVTSKVSIKQVWHNPFLTWDHTNFHSIDHIRMKKDEIWIPDIELYNSANNPSLQTSHLHEDWVTVYRNGTNVRVSLAILNSECEIGVNKFPFDKQECLLDFASESYEADSLDIHLLSGETQTKVDGKPYFKEINNGEWNIKNIKLERVIKKGDLRAAPFVHVELKMSITRIPTFYILYLICPCSVLSLLVFFSFVIPPESGERIGFCSSLLLSLSVYLLLFSDILPRNSRNVSLLGVIFVFIFLEAALVLVSTLLVLKVYHANSKIPAIIKFLFLCECSSKKKKKAQCNKIKPINKKGLKEEPSLVITSETADANEELSSDKTSQELQDTENEQLKAEENQERWLKVARKLDRLFFWLFFTVLLVSLGAVLVFSDELSNLSQALQD